MSHRFLDDLFRPDRALYFSDVRFAQIEHTDTGLADTAADRERQVIFQNSLLKRVLGALLAAGELQLSLLCVGIDANTHGRELQRDVQYRIIDDDIGIQLPVIIVRSASVVRLAGS